MRLDSSIKGVKAKQKSVVSEVPGVRVKQNGVITTVWVLATPYTVVFTDYPLVEGESDYYSEKSVATNDTGYTISAKKSESVTGYGYVDASVVLPTQKCNKVKVKYSTSERATASINGNVVEGGATDQYITFDCSGDEFSLELYVNDATAYYLSTLTITEISFYHE